MSVVYFGFPTAFQTNMFASILEEGLARETFLAEDEVDGFKKTLYVVFGCFLILALFY